MSKGIVCLCLLSLGFSFGIVFKTLTEQRPQQPEQRQELPDKRAIAEAVRDGIVLASLMSEKEKSDASLAWKKEDELKWLAEKAKRQ